MKNIELLKFCFSFRFYWPYGSSGAADLDLKVLKDLRDFKVRRPRTTFTLTSALRNTNLHIC